MAGCFLQLNLAWYSTPFGRCTYTFHLSNHLVFTKFSNHFPEEGLWNENWWLPLLEQSLASEMHRWTNHPSHFQPTAHILESEPDSLPRMLSEYFRVGTFNKALERNLREVACQGLYFWEVSIHFQSCNSDNLFQSLFQSQGIQLTPFLS